MLANKQNKPQNTKRNCVVQQIKQTVIQNKKGWSSGNKPVKNCPKKQIDLKIEAVNKIQRCWRNYIVRKTRLQSNAIRAMLHQRSLLIDNIQQKRETNDLLQTELYEMTSHAKESLQLSIVKQKHRLTEIVQKGIRHVFEEQSQIIQKEQQISLYQQIIAQQSGQYQSILDELERAEKEHNEMQQAIDRYTKQLYNLSQQLKQEHLGKSRLEYEREMLLADNTRLLRLKQLRKPLTQDI